MLHILMFVSTTAIASPRPKHQPFYACYADVNCSRTPYACFAGVNLNPCVPQPVPCYVKQRLKTKSVKAVKCSQAVRPDRAEPVAAPVL
jgi:hypothetical protein